jgi:DNA polymerase-1
MLMSDGKLVLVDGSSYLYRAYHALPKLTSSRGEPTGAVHGVLSMILKLAKEQDTEHFAVVFDAPGKTFRDEMFEAYKANRPPMPDELRLQIDPLLEAVPAMGLPMLRVEGVEADDVIGTLCRQAAADGMQVLVSTGDKDMAQLVDDNITLVNTMSGTVLDRDGVKKKFDVFPEQIIDYLALVGDSSDNIPGVPRVGAKTAAKWLNQYGSAASIIENAEEISGKVGESLRDNLDQLKLSQDLATIRQDVDLSLGPTELKRSEGNTETLRALYKRLELRTLLRQLGSEGEVSPEKAKTRSQGKYQTVLTQSAFDAWLKKIDKAALTAVDTETTSINYMQAELVGISLSVKTGEAAYVPVAHDYPAAPEQLSRESVLSSLKAFLENPDKKKVGHHLKYDAHIFARYGIALKGMQFDSMLESYDARVVRLEQCCDTARYGFDRAPLSRHRHHSLRGCCRQGCKTADVQPDRSGAGRAVRGRRRGHYAQAARTSVGRAAEDRHAERCLHGNRTTAGADIARDGGSGRSHRSRYAEEAKRRTCKENAWPGEKRARPGRRSVQPGLTEAVTGNIVRSARPARDTQDAQGTTVHG